jgi:hypothetical protein
MNKNSINVVIKFIYNKIKKYLYYFNLILKRAPQQYSLLSNFTIVKNKSIYFQRVPY